MPTCPVCSADTDAAARFCPSCGAHLDETSVATVTSPPDAGTARRSKQAAAGQIAERRFLPGTIIGDRYRVVALVGEGGMGEVYRADDLKLGHPVALKFLPRERLADPAWLERFHAEVRLARQISHPNVCRVYDIADVDGQHFLSMEYVDGEHLGSLLRRIGRLPSDKALDIARQLCAGLAAAHDTGVLHRDLKPANIMIDGRGRARITDFGIAAPIDMAARSDAAGTPAYMAPEQLDGGTASIATDVYALGLVLYEAFTGHPAFMARTLLERAHQRETTPTTPSALITDVDPVVERLILRCLSLDPRHRPSSALAVAAALPGGDPLAAALAAGETPSPELVASAGAVGGLRPVAGWACLLAVVVAWGVVAWLSRETTLLGLAPLELAPQALADRARQVATRLGYADASDTADGFEYDVEYLRYARDQLRPGSWQSTYATGPALAPYYWYRQSPQALTPPFPGNIVLEDGPPHVVPGMVRVVLDGRGRLIRFDAVPREARQDIPAAAAPADWQALFTDAGLSLAEFAPAEPDRIPPVYADGRQAWTGTYPGRSDIAIRVEGATLGAVPVYFHVTGAWTTSALPERSGAPEVITAFTAGLLILVIVVGGLLARRNLRYGRSDVTGARRLAIVVFLMGWGAWLLAADHVASFDEVELLFTDLSTDLFNAALLWLAYVALEPLVRRRWPHLMTSWTRLLAGRWRDPLVGRDVLIGTVAVTTGVASVHAINRLALLAGWMPAQPIDAIPVLLDDGLLDYAGWVLAFFGSQASMALALMLLLLLLSLALRRWTLSAAALVAIVSTIYAIGAADSMNPIAGAVFGAIGPVVLVRYGVLATVAATGFSLLTLMTPITFDPSAWYMANGLFLIALTLAAATYGFSVALAGQPLFGRALLDDH